MELTAVLLIPALAAGLVLLPALARFAAAITLVASGLTLVLAIADRRRGRAAPGH